MWSGIVSNIVSVEDLELVRHMNLCWAIQETNCITYHSVDGSLLGEAADIASRHSKC